MRGFFGRREVRGSDNPQDNQEGNQGDRKPDFSKRLIKNRVERAANLRADIGDRCEKLLKNEPALRKCERTIFHCPNEYVKRLIKNLQEHVANGEQASYDELNRLKRLGEQLENIEKRLQPHLKDWNRRRQDDIKLYREFDLSHTSLLNDLKDNTSLFTTQELKKFNGILDDISTKQRKSRETILNYLAEEKSTEGEYTSTLQCNEAFKELERCNEGVKCLKLLLRQNIITKKFDRHYDQLLQWAPLSEDVMNCKPHVFRIDLNIIDMQRRQKSVELFSKKDMREWEQELPSFDHWCKNAFEKQERHLKSYLETTSEQLNSQFNRVHTQLLLYQSFDPSIPNILNESIQTYDAAYEKMCSATNLHDYKQTRASFKALLESLEQRRNRLRLVEREKHETLSQTTEMKKQEKGKGPTAPGPSDTVQTKGETVADPSKPPEKSDSSAQKQQKSLKEAWWQDSSNKPDVASPAQTPQTSLEGSQTEIEKEPATPGSSDTRPYSGSERASLEINTQMDASPLTMTPTGIESTVKPREATVAHYVSSTMKKLLRHVDKRKNKPQKRPTISGPSNFERLGGTKVPPSVPYDSTTVVQPSTSTVVPDTSRTPEQTASQAQMPPKPGRRSQFSEAIDPEAQERTRLAIEKAEKAERARQEAASQPPKDPDVPTLSLND